MQRRQGLRGATCSDLVPQAILVMLKGLQLRHQGSAAAGVRDGLDHGPDAPVDACKIPSSFARRDKAFRLTRFTSATYAATKVSTSSGASRRSFSPINTLANIWSRKDGAAIGARVSLTMIGASETTVFSNHRHATAAETAARTSPDSSQRGRRLASNLEPTVEFATASVSAPPASCPWSTTVRRAASSRCCTALHRLGSMIRSAGTGSVIHALGGLEPIVVAHDLDTNPNRSQRAQTRRTCCKHCDQQTVPVPNRAINGIADLERPFH